jgi:hypothetical protein
MLSTLLYSDPCYKYANRQSRSRDADDLCLPAHLSGVGIPVGMTVGIIPTPHKTTARAKKARETWAAA